MMKTSLILLPLAEFPALLLNLLLSALLRFRPSACVQPRSPQTAAELFDQLPRTLHGGEVQGAGRDGRAHAHRRRCSTCKARDAHLLEFNRIAYDSSPAADEAPLKGEAAITGTISAPGGEIHLEDTSGAGGWGRRESRSIRGQTQRRPAKGRCQVENGLRSSGRLHGQGSAVGRARRKTKKAATRESSRCARSPERKRTKKTEPG